MLLLSEGQMSDYKGAALMIDALPRAKVMLAESALGDLTARLTSLEQQAAALRAAQGEGSAAQGQVIRF